MENHETIVDGLFAFIIQAGADPAIDCSLDKPPAAARRNFTVGFTIAVALDPVDAMSAATYH